MFHVCRTWRNAGLVPYIPSGATTSSKRRLRVRRVNVNFCELIITLRAIPNAKLLICCQSSNSPLYSLDSLKKHMDRTSEESPIASAAESTCSYFDGSLSDAQAKGETLWIVTKGPTSLDALHRLPLPGLDHVFNPVRNFACCESTCSYLQFLPV